VAPDSDLSAHVTWLLASRKSIYGGASARERGLKRRVRDDPVVRRRDPGAPLPRWLKPLADGALDDRDAAYRALRNYLDRTVHTEKAVKEMGAIELVCPQRTGNHRDFDRLM
jgi:hypothetical protein